MIWVLKVKLVGGMYATGEWEGVIEMDASASLQELHLAIQDALNFDNDHMYEFFIARTERSRERESFDDENGEVYEQTLADLFPLPDKQHLYYWFDYGDDWMFKISKARKSYPLPSPDVTYPRLIQETGEKPEQYPDSECED
jgi:hypothetical protein